MTYDYTTNWGYAFIAISVFGFILYATWKGRSK